jgi:hypothetical protein
MPVDRRSEGFGEQVEDVGFFGQFIYHSDVGLRHWRLGYATTNLRRKEIYVISQNEGPGGKHVSFPVIK